MTVLYIGVVVAALVVVRWLIETIKRDGALQAKLDQMGKDAEIAAKRAEEMLKEKTVEEWKAVKEGKEKDSQLKATLLIN